MHIPDGFLSTGVCLATGAASGASLVWMARRAQAETEESRAPLLGVMGAFVFAAQMINFPVGVGTTGHLLGGALLAITLGPASAVVVMAAILVVQALVFQDGGVLALGANVFNMAVAGVLAGYLPYRLLLRAGGREVAVFIGRVLVGGGQRPAGHWGIAAIRDQDSHGHPGRVGGPVHRERSGWKG